LAGVDRTGQQFGLKLEAAVIGRCQLRAEQWQVLQSMPDAEEKPSAGAFLGLPAKLVVGRMDA
jgi:hypothetical protein